MKGLGEVGGEISMFKQFSCKIKFSLSSTIISVNLQRYNIDVCYQINSHTNISLACIRLIKLVIVFQHTAI